MTGSEVVAAARGTPEQQAEATSKFAKHFEELLTAGLTLAGASKVEREERREREREKCMSKSSIALCITACYLCTLAVVCVILSMYCMSGIQV